MDHSKAAKEYNLDEERVNWHDKALWYLRHKRDIEVKEISEWEKLKDAASEIKMDVLSNLDIYLEEFEQKAQANGVHVHWAEDGNEHNRIVKELLVKHGAKSLVKSKSMLTEECGLNHYLEKQGIEVIDTDLGERIVQLAGERPSHITAPAIHKTKEEVDELFQAKLGAKPSKGDPQTITQVARNDLRSYFLKADASLTGVNFALADSGGFVVCTNEGNADMGVHQTPLHIASMGIEKLIPKTEHLGVFLRLLARSASGQSITSYSSHFFKPGIKQEIHVVIVDNGRSNLLGKDDFRNSMKCIRCGACMNTCPIFRRSGGHSYGSVIPGPIGSILSPNISMKEHSSLPFASTLCGSCTDICPVRIDIDTQLYKWRQLILKKHPKTLKKLIMKGMAMVFNHPKIFDFVGRIFRKLMLKSPRFLLYNRYNVWGKNRELPPSPKQSFKEWYRINRKANDGE